MDPVPTVVALRPGARGGAQQPVAPAAWLDRADLMFCLARAFLPPPAGMSVAAWAEPLAADLQELAGSLGLDAQLLLGMLRDLVVAPDGNEECLVAYSRLFLVPPVPVPLNTGVYLEGAIGGRSAQMIAQCYGTAGVAPLESFHDLPDHAAMQFEFVARLYERAARGDPDAGAMAQEFAAAFMTAWLEPLQRACRAAAADCRAAPVYRELAGLAEAALA